MSDYTTTERLFVLVSGHTSHAYMCLVELAQHSTANQRAKYILLHMFSPIELPVSRSLVQQNQRNQIVVAAFCKQCLGPGVIFKPSFDCPDDDLWAMARQHWEDRLSSGL